MPAIPRLAAALVAAACGVSGVAAVALPTAHDDAQAATAAPSQPAQSSHSLQSAPTSPAAPSIRHRANPRAWIARSRSGLVGPASAVLAGAPHAGTIRIVTTTADAAGHMHVHVVTARAGAAARAAVDKARTTPGVVSVGVDHRSAIATVPQTDDTYRSQQWAMTRLQAETVWSNYSTKGTGVTVAVVDTGVDATHPDLAGRVLPGKSFISDGGNADGTSDPNGHGTHVAGIITAIADNGIGVAGLADGAKILPVRALAADGTGNDSDIASGIDWAVDQGARIINVSLGGVDNDPVLATAVNYAAAHDVLLVAAAGNDGQDCSAVSSPQPGQNCGDPTFYPAADTGALAVGATDSTDTIASFSETGPYVAISAPGVDIASTYPGDQYYYMSGTSMAAPYVSASAALLLAAHPGMSATDMRSLLTSTADDLGDPGRDDSYGAGLVDPLAALTAAADGTQPAQPTTSPTTAPAPAPVSNPGGPAPIAGPAPTSPASPTPVGTTPPASPPAAAPAVRLALSATRVVSGTRVGLIVTVRAPAGTVAGTVSGPVQVCTRTRRATECGDETLTDGAYRAVLRPVTGTVVTARIVGSSTYAASTAVAARITVVPAIMLSGRGSLLSVGVSPAEGQRFAVQVWTAGGWRTVAGSRASSAVPALLHERPGTYRVVVAAAVDVTGATSRPFRLR